MQINITGHGVIITDAIREYTNDKFDKLKHRADNISNIKVVLDVEKMQQIAKATLHLAGTDIHAHAESEDLYSAIDLLIDKLNHQIIKHKEKQKNHRERENNQTSL